MWLCFIFEKFLFLWWLRVGYVSCRLRIVPVLGDLPGTLSVNVVRWEHSVHNVVDLTEVDYICFLCDQYPWAPPPPPGANCALYMVGGMKTTTGSEEAQRRTVCNVDRRRTVTHPQ
jgi:hypothetical protein